MLVAGVLLIVALAAVLAVGKWKRRLSAQDILKPLGANIQQEANGFTYTQAHGDHMLFKIHASKVVQLKNDQALLHDVKIELYGADGTRVDRIEGNEFEYDQAAGIAKANGPVEITLMRPGEAPAVAPKATTAQAEGQKPANKAGTLASAAQTAAKGEIHVKTTGLVFEQKSGVATTAGHVDFSITQGTGSSMGATYDSQQGHLVLDRQVELNERRGADNVLIHAQHAEFERGDMVCNLHAATADYRGGEATAGEAKILFREDGSAVRLDATGGFTLATSNGGHLAAPMGWVEFNEHNQPRHGHLEGGVTMDSVRSEGNSERKSHGTSPTAELEFTSEGELQHAHLERGVQFSSDERSESRGTPLHVSRMWQSPVADVQFREARKGQVEPASIHGTSGVVITGESQRGQGAATPSRMTADEVTGTFGADSVITAMAGVGHANLVETNEAGTRQESSGDRLVVSFATGSAKGGGNAGQGNTKPVGSGEENIQSATLEGHVVLVQEPAAKPGAAAEAPMRATAGRADYEGAGEWLHLTQSPRVDDGGLQLTADKIDVSRTTGDAFAHDNVKATWLDTGTNKPSQPSNTANPSAANSNVALGGQGPAHVVANEAQLHQGPLGATATFKGQARLWQQSNSVAAPVIVLDRQRQTLVARSTDAADPVRVVLLSAAVSGPGREGSPKKTQPSVIRVRGGDLKYSDAERKAVMHGGAGASVVAETGTATSDSDEVELILLPPGNHAARDGGQAQVDRMTARGHVVVTSEGRRGTGEQLVYSSETGEYVLTGTGSSPPRMSDPARGNVTGEALIFNSRDDSVSIEGGGRKTTTETRTPK